ncbi:MAG TPA: universal stress protein [Longimicrobiales bacterium]
MPFGVRSILAGSDLSTRAGVVLQSAAALAALADADLHVVHAVEAPAGDASGKETEAQLERARRALHEQFHSVLPRPAQVISARVAPGAADAVILERAAEIAADLIVIGPHRVAERRERLGATADRLVRSSAVPCLILHEPIALPLRRVLLPTDFSNAARGGLDMGLTWSAALRMPARSGATTRVEVVHVRTGDAPAAEAQLHEQVRAACDATGCAGTLSVFEEVVDDGTVPEAILRLARERGADLLVLGTRGAGAATDAEIGSVSAVIARSASSPVLLIPPRYWIERQAREAALRR